MQNKIKNRPQQYVPYHKVPKHEEDAKRLRKDNSPSPVTYNTDAAKEKCSGSPYQDKSNRYYRIGKSPKKLFTDDVIRSAKKLPGVGEYRPEDSIDKGRVSKPMRPNRAQWR